MFNIFLCSETTEEMVESEQISGVMLVGDKEYTTDSCGMCSEFMKYMGLSGIKRYAMISCLSACVHVCYICFILFDHCSTFFYSLSQPAESDSS